MVERVVKIGYDADDVLAALYRHHPAYDGMSGMQWVCLREWNNIDLLAIECWRQARVIGYEVKVSRGDMRAELLDPAKRAEAVSRTTQFYFAVPAGMLKAEEIAFEEPEDWVVGSNHFKRAPCPGMPKIDLGRQPIKRHLGLIGGRCSNPRHDHRGKLRRSRWVAKSTPSGFSVRLPVPAVLRPRSGTTIYDELGAVKEQHHSEWDIQNALETQGYALVTCPTCGGSGYSELSEVERIAPTLWVPRDCGLVEIDSRGVTIVKRAPVRKNPKLINGRAVDHDNTCMGIDVQCQIERHGLAQLVRHASAYHDPRHRDHRAR